MKPSPSISEALKAFLRTLSSFSDSSVAIIGMAQSHKSLTSHLEKSIISNVIQTARACLNEPSRPFTPAESQRTLFAQNDYSTRPPSSYVPKGRPVVRRASQEGAAIRKEKPVLKEAVKLQGRDLELAETPKAEPQRPVKPRADVGRQGPVSLLQGLIDREELRKTYREEDWKLLADALLTEGGSLALEAREDLCSQILTAAELTTEVTPRLLLLKAAFILLQDLSLLSLKPNGKLKPNSVLQSACKLVYLPSKVKTNDVVFQGLSFIEVLYDVLVRLLSDELVELDGGEHSAPFQTLVYLIGTLKNLTDDDGGRQQALNVGLIVVLARLLPLPDSFSPSVHPEYV